MEVIRIPPGTYRAPVMHVPGSSGAAGRPLVVVTFPPRPGPPPLSTSIVLYDWMGEEFLSASQASPFPSPHRRQHATRSSMLDLRALGLLHSTTSFPAR